jgi:A/G-specific adenine glycosylase
VPKFSDQLLAWFDQHGRKDLPWQIDRTPYSVWLSEIMLQQTQVATVIPYYQRFIRRFPDVSSLALAEPDEVLEHWAGLGYYSRARNLHKTAQIVCEVHECEFPADLDELQALPGIGRSTAGAILAQAFGQRAVILDGNVKRVLTRYAGIRDWPGKAAVQNQLWALADDLTPENRVTDYTQAIMDLGATLCSRKPDCLRCPVKTNCVAREQDLTAQIPAKKPSRKIPIREINMLVLRNERDEILLERRPPSGIWGGLWSLPECQPHALQDHLGSMPGTAEVAAVLDTREHQFSHFRLRFTPVEIRYEDDEQRLLETNQCIWYKRGENSALGFPAPVKVLLEELSN